MCTAAIGSPVAGLTDSSRSPPPASQPPSKAPGFSSASPSAASVRVVRSLLVSTTIMLSIGPCGEAAETCTPPPPSAPTADSLSLAMAALPALLPPLLLALFASWCGSFAGGATFSGSAGGAAALLAAVLAAGPAWRDPWRLGRGRLLPLGLWAVVAASAWFSPVERAGRTAVELLPAFLWLPAVVE